VEGRESVFVRWTAGSTPDRLLAARCTARKHRFAVLGDRMHQDPLLDVLRWQSSQRGVDPVPDRPGARTSPLPLRQDDPPSRGAREPSQTRAGLAT
jgi:hypothetical protein